MDIFTIRCKITAFFRICYIFRVFFDEKPFFHVHRADKQKERSHAVTAPIIGINSLQQIHRVSSNHQFLVSRNDHHFHL